MCSPCRIHLDIKELLIHCTVFKLLDTKPNAAGDGRRRLLLHERSRPRPSALLLSAAQRVPSGSLGSRLIADACAGSAPGRPRQGLRQGRCTPRGPRWVWPREQISCAWRRNLRRQRALWVRAERVEEPKTGPGRGRRPRPRQGPQRVSFVYVAARCAV